MPNRPRNPNAGIPIKAGIGFAFMVVAAGIYAVRHLVGADWAMFAAGVVAALVLVMIVRGASVVKIEILCDFFHRRRPNKKPSTTPQSSFDVDAFISTAQKNAGAVGSPHKDTERVRKLTVLKEHPNTPEPERQAATLMLTRQTRSRSRRKKRGAA